MTELKFIKQYLQGAVAMPEAQFWLWGLLEFE
jgi:hypothetical protein